jgi:hypothetical protein
MNSAALQVDSARKSLKINPLNLGLFGFGALINAATYLSFAPVLLAILFYWFFYTLLYFPPLGGVWERRIFTRVFLAGFLMAGVAAVYANHFLDSYQLSSDAGGFHEMAATSPSRYLPLIPLQALHEGALAIKLWAVVYDFFAALGFPRERYVGILINVCAVALTGVVALKMARIVYDHDVIRFKRLILLFSLCGLFWLFASIHLRDSIVLLAVTALAYSWLYFLQKPDLSYRLIVVIASSLLAGAFFGFLRGEFIFVPIATAMAATTALMFGVQSKRRVISYILIIIGLGVAGWLVLNFGDAIQSTLTRGNQLYAAHGADQNGADSLGMALIVNQPLPIRVLLGSIYLFVFPIPFWSGFQSGTAHHFFKSTNVIFFYFLLPLLVLSLRKVWADKSVRSPAIIFLLLFSTGFTVAIAGTSLETRHFGVFLPPMFLLALLPDFCERSVRVNYKQLLMFTLTGVLLVHLAWVAIKI